MSTLTAAEIKTILETATFPTNEGIEINAALMQNEERRKYPSIDIQNVTGEESFKDVPTTNTTQVFLVHLFYRYRSFGEQHEPDIKVIEDEIFDTLDANANFSTDVKISVVQSWDRKSEIFPVHRSHSILRVTAKEIKSTDGEGIPGDSITITLPSPVGTIDVIDVLADESGIIKDLDLTVDEQIYTKIRNRGLLSLSLAVGVDAENDIKDLIFVGNDISITFTKGGVASVRTANLIDIVASGTRKEVHKQVLAMESKPRFGIHLSNLTSEEIDELFERFGDRT
jgi:hypothetical protein